MGRSKTTRTLAYSTASSRARSATPTSSAARPTETSSSTRRHSGAWSPGGPERLDRLLVEHQPGQLAGGVEAGDHLGLGRRQQERADALLGQRHHDGPVGGVAVDHHRLGVRSPPIRRPCAGPGPGRCPVGGRGPARAGPPCPACRPEARPASRSSAPRARAASVAITDEEKNGPGSGTRPICSRTMHISSSPAPSPGTSIPVQPMVTNRSQSSGVTPTGSSASCRSVSPPTSPMARRATSCRASCSASNVKSTVHPRSGVADVGDSVDSLPAGSQSRPPAGRPARHSPSPAGEAHWTFEEGPLSVAERHRWAPAASLLHRGLRTGS